MATPVVILLFALLFFLIWRRRRKQKYSTLSFGEYGDKVAAMSGIHPSGSSARYIEPPATVRTPRHTYGTPQARIVPKPKKAVHVSSNNGAALSEAASSSSEHATWQSQDNTPSAEPTPLPGVNTHGVVAVKAARQKKRIPPNRMPAVPPLNASRILGDQLPDLTTLNASAQQPSRRGLIHDDLTTEELVHALNARLQASGPASLEEHPPEYDDVGART